MNETQKAFVAGMQLAYKDVASLLKNLSDTAPEELKPWFDSLANMMIPALRRKSEFAESEAMRFAASMDGKVN